MDDSRKVLSLKLSDEGRSYSEIAVEVASTPSSEIEQLWHSMDSKEFRDAYVSEHIDFGVSMQIRENRKMRGWTQKELGLRADMKQGYVCRLENPDSGAPNLETLKRLASAFDVALVVRFVPFSELANWASGIGFGSLAVVPFEKDNVSNETVTVPTKTIEDNTGEVFSRDPISEDETPYFVSTHGYSPGRFHEFVDAGDSSYHLLEAT